MSDPQSFSRNEHGLLGNVQYTYNNDGSINWRAMIDNKHLVVNKNVFPEGADIPSDVSQLNDGQSLLLLAGLKELANLRGFTNVNYEVTVASKVYVAVKCTISWIPNYESGMQPVQFSALADTHESNTSGFGKKFLMAVSENRAFSRAVRNFLRINIIGQDEVDPNEDEVIFEFF